MKSILLFLFLYTLATTLFAPPLFAQVQVRGDLPFMQKEKKETRWVAYYGHSEKSESFLPYDVVVFDADKHPSLSPLINRNKVLLGYISLGEIENYRPFYAEIKAKGIILAENPNWPGNFALDVRHPAWRKLILEEIIPSLIRAGFNGIMLDTVDSAIALEQQDPKKYAGMAKATVEIIKAIRMHYPRLHIMLNRGFEILPEVSGDIDMFLAETIFTTHDFKTQKAGFVADNIYQSLVELLKKQQAANPRLQIFTLDYWPTKDDAALQKITKAQRDNGFIPQVSTVHLQSLPYDLPAVGGVK
jgi:uncharacterized protein (TIGR01370 family)